MTTMRELENNIERDFREAFRWRLGEMEKDELRGFADEDGDLDVGDLAAHIFEEMNDDGATHEVVDGAVPIYYGDQAEALASRPGISEHLHDLGGPVAADLWANIAACIYRELEDHLSGVAVDLGIDVISEAIPDLSIDPEVDA